MHWRLVVLVSVLGSGAAYGQTAPSAFEYHGYLRSGIGVSRGGTDQACFGAPGASAKFRLGNECETYLEAELVHVQPATADAAGPAFKTHVRFAAVTGQAHDWEGTSPEYRGKEANGDPKLGQEFTLALREAYVEGQKVLGPARPWAGKRFYRRQDIHILDYYIIATSGPGAGVEDIPAGVGTLHAAVIRNTPGVKTDSPAQTNVDLRLSDVKLGGAGALEVLVIEATAGKRSHATGQDAFEPLTGTQLGLVHTLPTPVGNNRVTLQYGVGLFGGDGASRSNLLSTYGDGGTQAVAKGDSATAKARKDSKSTRVVEELTTQLGQTFSSSFVVLWQRTDFGGFKAKPSDDETPEKAELMAGVRPVFALGAHTGLALEYGYVNVKNAFADNGKYKDAALHKVTIAPQVTAGADFWARPQLRLFATYAKWNDDAKGHIGGAEYAGDTNGFSTGAQVEAWW